MHNYGKNSLYLIRIAFPATTSGDYGIVSYCECLQGLFYHMTERSPANSFPANRRRLPDVGLTLARRRRRRANVKQTSGKRLLSAGTWNAIRQYNLKVSSCSTALYLYRSPIINLARVVSSIHFW